MGVVDVVAGAVGEHRVDEVGLDLGCHRALGGEAAGVDVGVLVLEVPPDLGLRARALGRTRQLVHVGVDQNR
jgi:hypothetical protein